MTFQIVARAYKVAARHGDGGWRYYHRRVVAKAYERRLRTGRLVESSK